jgi:hypothetical protein
MSGDHDRTDETLLQNYYTTVLAVHRGFLTVVGSGG